MIGNSYYIPEPPMFVSISPPDPAWRSRFYNPKQTEEGRQALDGFLTSFAEMFKFSANGSEITSQINESVAGFSFADALGIEPGEPFDFNGLSGSDALGLLVAASDAKTRLNNLRDQLGEDLSNWNERFSSSGAYDSQVLAVLLGAYNGLTLSVPAQAQDRINERIAGLNPAALADWCEQLGIELEENDDGEIDYGQAREDLLEAAGERFSQLSSPFPQFNADSLNDVSDSLIKESAIPAIALVGVNMTGRAMHRTVEANSKILAERMKELEREEKKSMQESAAERKSESKKAENRQRAETMQANQAAKKQGGRKA